MDAEARRIRQNEYNKAYRRRHPERVRAQLAQHRAKSAERLANWLAGGRDRHNEFVDDAKRGPCLDCGRTFPPIAMDFDHVRGTKVASVAILVRDGASMAELQAEIDKCDLVCACCHRIRHAERRSSNRMT